MKAAFVTLVALLAGGDLLAHDEKWSDSRVEVSDRDVVWRVRVSIVALEKVMTFPADAIDLSEKQLQSVKEEIVRNLRRGMGLEVNGAAVEPETGELEPVYEELPLSGEPYIGHVDQIFRFTAAEDIDRLEFAVGFFGWLTEQHEAGLTLTWGESSRRYIRRGPATVAATYDEFHPTFWTILREFGLRGLRVFLTAAPAAAFLLVTLLGCPRLRDTLLAAGGFALSTLAAAAIAALGVVSVRSGIVEALMAASVMYGAAENVLTRDARFRWVVTLVFGLAHGFALGSGLGPVTEAQGTALPLIFFGLGLAAGQAALLLTAGPVFHLVRGGLEAPDARRRRVILFGSIPLALLGAVWMIEQLGSVEILPL